MDNISFIGMAGCGKSTLGKAISEKHGLSFIDTDDLIESEYKMTLEDVKKEFGYKFVRSAEEKAILGLDRTTKIISTGGSAIYSSISMHHLMSFSKIIYIDTPLDEIVKRIGIGQKRGLAVPAGISVSDVYLERKPLYEKFSQLTVDGSKSIEQLVSEVNVHTSK
jgi:shikimate kinase